MSNNRTEQESKAIFKEWLEKLQQESWQLELIISGFAIFGIYSARTLIADFSFFRENEVYGDIAVAVGLIGFIFSTGWVIFFLNLLVHVILRGLWIGTIGLRYVSEEIDYDSLGYSPRFTSFLKNKVGSYDNFIESLEKICSVLFAFTFLLFLLFTSLMIFVLQLLVFILLMSKINDANQTILSVIGLFVAIYLFFGLVVFIDLISLGAIKKIKEKHISKIYFYIYRFYGFVTLSFLYRPLLYNFIDNRYTRKLFYLSIPYIFLVIGGYRMIENNPNPYYPDEDLLLSEGLLIDDYYYDDLRNSLLQEFPNEERKINKQHLKWIALKEFNIKESNTSIFIKLDKGLKNLIELDTLFSPYRKAGLAFSWFNASVIEDKAIQKLDKIKQNELSDLRSKRKDLTKKVKKSNENGEQQMIDSLTRLIEIRTEFWRLKLAKAESKKLNLIMNFYLKNVALYIDAKKIPLDNCFYYHHPHFNEQGLKCFFSTDTLSKGIHQVKFTKYFADKQGDVVKDSIFLPILKH